VLDDSLESVDPDDLMRAPVLFEHVAVVPLVEPADMDNENPAITIAVTIAVRYGNLRRRTVATSLAATSSVDFTDLLTSPPF
jgi:hypothetical protein